MPLKTFWMLYKNIDRIQARRDIRTAMIAIKTQSQEGVSNLFRGLQEEQGAPEFDVDRGIAAMEVAQLDREGLARLKAKAGR